MSIASYRSTIPLVAGVAAFAGFLATLAHPGSAAWLLVWLNLIAVILPFYLAAIRRRIDLFEPVYLFSISFFIAFVLRPILDLSSRGGVPPIIVGQDPGPMYTFALAASLLGILAFYGGYYLPLGRLLGKRIPLPSTRTSASSVNSATVGAVIIASVLIALFVAQSGGLSTLKAVLSGRNKTTSDAYAGSSGYLYTAPLWLFSLGMLYLARSRSWRSFQGYFGFALVFFSLITPTTRGDRSWLLPAILSIGILYYVRQHRRPRIRTVLLLAPVLFFFGGVLPGQYRFTDTRHGGLGDTISRMFSDPRGSASGFFVGLDTAMVDDLAIEMQFVPGQMSWQKGRTLLDAMTTPIPRNLWPGKPLAGDLRLMRTIWYELWLQNVQFTFSLFGEPYLNFGYPGIAVALFILGVAWRALYEWFIKDPGNAMGMLFFALSWPFLFVYMRGGIGVDYPRQLFAILPAALTILVAHVRTTSGLKVPSVRPSSSRQISSAEQIARSEVHG